MKSLLNVFAAIVVVVTLQLSSQALAQSVNDCAPPTNSLMRVVDVATNDTLNVRAGIGTDFAIIDTLPPNSETARFTGTHTSRTSSCAQLCNQSPFGSIAYEQFYNTCVASGRIWYQLRTSTGVTGWASARYLQVADIQTQENSPLLNELTRRISDNLLLLEEWALLNFLAPQVQDISQMRSMMEGIENGNVEDLQAVLDRSDALLFSLGLLQSECSLNNINACSEIEVCQRATVQEGAQRRWAYQTQPTYVEIAEKAGFTCNVASREPFTEEMAVRYLNAMVDYVSVNTSEFGLDFAERFNSVRPILSGNWSGQLSANFENFLIFSEQFSGFQSHWQDLETQRQALDLLRLEELRSEFSIKLATLNEWALVNIIDPKAAEIAALTRSASELSSQSAEEILYLIDQANTILTATGIGQQTATEDLDIITDQIFNPYTIYIMANASPGAGAEHVYINTTASLALYQDMGFYCFASQFDQFEKYLVGERLKQYFNDANFSISECSETIDFIVIRGSDITSDVISDTIPISNTVSLDEITADEKQLEISEMNLTSNMIANDVRDGARIGYGIIQFFENQNQICALISQDIEVHSRILTGQQSILSVFGLVFDNFVVDQGSLDDVFRSLQRSQCGSVYSNAADLNNLFLAGQSAGFETQFLPIWISERQVVDMANVVETERAEINAAAQNLEANLRLEREALRSALEEAAIQQALLREQYDLPFTALNEKIFDLIEEAILFGINVSISSEDYEAQYSELRSIDPASQRSVFDRLISDVRVLSDRQWETTRRDLVRIDYGIGLFNRRPIEAMISELQIQMRNPIAGQFDVYCKKVMLLNDDVFEMIREVLISDCDDLRSEELWRNRTSFESNWIVEARN